MVLMVSTVITVAFRKPTNYVLLSDRKLRPEQNTGNSDLYLRVTAVFNTLIGHHIVASVYLCVSLQLYEGDCVFN